MKVKVIQLVFLLSQDNYRSRGRLDLMEYTYNQWMDIGTSFNQIKIFKQLRYSTSYQCSFKIQGRRPRVYKLLDTTTKFQQRTLHFKASTRNTTI